MDVLLIATDAPLARRLHAALTPQGHRVLRAKAGDSVKPALTVHAVLLGFDTPTAARLRVLQRLWSAEDAPPSYLVTSPGSRGDAMLAAVSGAPCPARAGARWRATRSLTFEAMLALGHVVG